MATDLIGSGRALLDEILGKIPESDRKTVADVLSKPEAQAALELAGKTRTDLETLSAAKGDLDRLRADFEAKRDKVNADFKKQQDWYTANKPLLDLGLKAHEAGWDPTSPGGDGTTPPPALPKDLVRQSDLEKMFLEREKGYAAFATAIPDLAIKHFQEFGERLDLGSLMTDPRVEELGVFGVYESRYREKYAEKAKKAEDARVEARVQERLAEERKTLRSRPPYPVGTIDPSPLDMLQSKTNGTEFGVDAAITEYEQLVAKRAG